MGIKNVVKRVGNRVGNRVAKLSELSSEQVERVQLEREQYLLEKPDPNDPHQVELTQRMLSASSVEIFNAYLPQIKELYLPIEKDAEYGEVPFDTSHNIRYVNITKWVTDPKENSLEKLVNVYAVLADEECNIGLIFNRTKTETNVYLAVVNLKSEPNNVTVEAYKRRLIEAIRGNFPGAEWGNDGAGIIPCLNNDKPYSVAMASNIPTEKSEKFISQTIEKLLDGIVPDSKQNEYTIVLLATPILDVEDRKMKLGEFYTGLSPYASWQTDFHFTDNQAFGSSATVGVNVGASAGIQNGRNSSITDTEGNTDSSSKTDTESQSDTSTSGTSTAESNSSSHSDGTSSTETTTSGTSGSDTRSRTETNGTSSSHASTSGESSGNSAGGGAGFIAHGEYSHNWGTNSSVTDTSGITQSIAEGVSSTKGWTQSTAKALGKTATDTLTKGLTNTVSNSLAKTTGTAVANTLGKAVTKSMAATSGIAKITNFGANFGASFARSSTVTAFIGKNEGITQSFTNFNIKHALELLESQMKRLEQSTALGMWDFAAYVLSEDQNIANNVAHTYLALTLGEESYMSKSAINLWKGKVEEEKQSSRVIASYIRELRHPVFGLNPEIVSEDEEYNVYPSITTATTSLSGKELAYSLNFPQRTIAGLPILESAEFGRNVTSYDALSGDERKVHLGSIFHMHHSENTSVELSQESLKSHVFVTGSTGSGKSNTVYQLLDGVRHNGGHFMVIEPAKGEYKNIFGGDEEVHVFGTNPLIMPLLRINPFSFPKSIHVLEHLDRLVEIFNVCWPMYAAMPAVLKSAVEKSYRDCGWDLVESTNRYGTELYPDFKSVASNIKTIIDSSEYDTDNKGAYKGALLMRLNSLASGINRMIFSTDEIPSEQLFNENCIVDLSRVGSTETKSLIMGMLILKLQEFRMTEGLPMNSRLRHVTVLEEAHNLLRRTSTEQTSETSNILGKSVEMLANAIAEMRTYGEGFIIADQAPGLMDMSVIRNTNTKIIMRLPDQGDRVLAGKAAGLNDQQIVELAKLPCGVAAVYQNEWVQPVLCKVEKYDGEVLPFQFDSSNSALLKQDDELSQSLLKSIMDNELFQRGDKDDLRELKTIVLKSGLNSLVKVEFLDYLEAEQGKALETLRALLYDLLEAEKAIEKSNRYSDLHEWVDAVVEELKPSVKQYSKKQIDLAIALILQEKSMRDSNYRDVYLCFTEAYRNGGGML